MLDQEEFTHTQEEEDAIISQEIARYRNIVLSACSSLGNMQPVDSDDSETRAENKMHYVPSPDCLASLKDIKRYIQMDEQGEGKLVLQWLGEWQVLEKDIIPIFTIYARRLIKCSDDLALKKVVSCIELFVFLTWSMDSETEEVKMQFIRILRSYKRAFAKDDVIFCLLAVAVMYTKRGNALTDREWMMVKGIMYIFRNILAIPDPLVAPAAGSLAAQVEVHDKLIAVLDKQLAIDFFLTLASSTDQKRFKDLRPTLLDIVYFLFYRVPVAALFSQHQSMWFKDSETHRDKSSRHNNFGGVFAVSTGEGTIMPVFSAREVLRPFANLFKRRAKVQTPKEQGQTVVDQQWRSVDQGAVDVLRRIAAVFIESCYNPFITVLFEDSRSGTTIVDDFMPRLLYVAAYFVDISLANPAIDLGCTCAVVQTHIFGLVMRHASSYVELREWGRLEPAMYCIQQVLLSLTKMRATSLDSLCENVLSNLFYDGDALDLFVQLCRVYKPTKTTRAFLVQVARLTETFLSTLASYAQSKAGLVVRKRVKKRVPKDSADAEADVDDDADHKQEQGDNDINDNAEAMEVEDDNDIGDEPKEAEGVEEVLVERELSIDRYSSAFAVGDVIKSYSHLLAPPISIEYVYPMLHRIAVICQRPQLFFKKQIMLRLLLLFDDQYTYSCRSEMIELAAWIFRQYVTVIGSPALTAHYRAESLDNRMAMECMLTFLKISGAGKSIDPVITKHLIKLQAGEDPNVDDDDDDDDKTNSANESKERPADGNALKPTSISTTAINAISAEINDDDLDFYGGYEEDFDFDSVFNS
ncbi:Topoisomerase 1-associated factor 1 [Coemansia asiatica]|nr:Topoisomerase 1-associated factor 1 [Coemansia asiatica]